MILTDFTVLGQDVVVEFSSQASWKSWGHTFEDSGDKFFFAGKFSLVYTPRRSPTGKRIVRVLTTASAAISVVGIALLHK